MKKKAIITGITGQDGSYLAELLLEKNYEIYGIVRRSSAGSLCLWRIAGIVDKLKLLEGDLLDYSSIGEEIRKIKPHEFYNLAAQSFVHVSFSQPIYTAESTGLGALRILDAIKCYSPETRFYQASSSEMYGKVKEIPQNESTPFHPRSPYGVSKVFAHYSTVNYREAYDLYAVSGILFNHESPRRGEEFVTKKIAKAVAEIKFNKRKCLELGNLEAQRDWGYAPEYVEAMWLMLQQKKPDDYVIGTGSTNTVQNFCEVAFGHVGLDWNKYVILNDNFKRPSEVDLLIADPDKAKKILNWQSKTSFNQLVEIMVDYEINKLRNG